MKVITKTITLNAKLEIEKTLNGLNEIFKSS